MIEFSSQFSAGVFFVERQRQLFKPHFLLTLLISWKRIMSRILSISSIFFKIKFLKYFFNSMDLIWVISNFINLSFVLLLVPLTKGCHFYHFKKLIILFDWFYALYFGLHFINYLTFLYYFLMSTAFAFGLLWWCHIK